MVIFKNNLIKLLSEAGEDLETSNDSDVSEDTGEVNEESNTEDSAEDTAEQNNDGEEETGEETSEDETEGDDSFSDDNDSEDGENSNDDNMEEESPSQENPYITKTYFERLKRIRDHHVYLEKIIRDNDKSLDDEVEDDYLSTVNYILDELSNSKDQIRLLIVKGKILNLDSKKLATVYNKIQTKLINLIDLYEKVLNKNL